MRLRDVLPHPNFVSSAMEMSDLELIWAANQAIEVQRTIQHMPPHPKEGDNENFWWDAEDWRDNILALMLLRDCLGREMVRRGLTPPGPPMLARNWEMSEIYEMVSSREIQMPVWISTAQGLAERAVSTYPNCEGE